MPTDLAGMRFEDLENCIVLLGAFSQNRLADDRIEVSFAQADPNRKAP